MAVLPYLAAECRFSLASACRAWRDVAALSEQRTLHFSASCRLRAGSKSSVAALGRRAVRLCLSGTVGDDASLRALLLGLAEQQALEELDLGYMQGISWKSLRALPHLPRLRILSLAGMTLCPQLFGYLGRPPTATALEELDLSGCRGMGCALDSSSPPDFTALSGLRVLRLRDAPPTSSARAGALGGHCPLGRLQRGGGELMHFLMAIFSFRWEGGALIEVASLAKDCPARRGQSAAEIGSANRGDSGAVGSGFGAAAAGRWRSLETLDIDAPSLASPDSAAAVLALARRLAGPGGRLQRLVLPRAMWRRVGTSGVNGVSGGAAADEVETLAQAFPELALRFGAAVAMPESPRSCGLRHPEWVALPCALPGMLPQVAPKRRSSHKGV